MTVTTRPAAGQTLRQLVVADPAYRADAYGMYADTFADIDGLAVQRHLMTAAEFTDVQLDDRIAKHTLRADGRIVGQSVITRDLAAWPLISPRYFARHWPDEYAHRRIFYVGYVCTAPGAPITAFRDLIADMAGPVFACNGIAVMDFCTANVLRRLPRATTAILRRIAPAGQAEGRRLDAQEFWAWRFDGRAL